MRIADIITLFESALIDHADAVLVVKTVADGTELLDITAGDSGAELLERRSIPAGTIAGLLASLNVPSMFDGHHWTGVVQVSGFSANADLDRTDNGGMHLRLVPIPS